MAGTTVDDMINGVPLMIIAMMQAFHQDGLTVNENQIHKFRGLEKGGTKDRDAIRSLLRELPTDQKMKKTTDTDANDDEHRVSRIFQTFSECLHANIARTREIEGTSEVFAILRAKGVKIAMGSGFPDSVVQQLITHLGWKKHLDYIGSAESVGKGRPAPDMIFDAMKKTQISDIGSVLKVGDTVADIEEGRNAGCFTVAVLTGTQTRAQLESAKPDRIVASVRDVVKLI